MKHRVLFGEVGSADAATNRMILKKLQQRPVEVNYLRTDKKIQDSLGIIFPWRLCAHIINVIIQTRTNIFRNLSIWLTEYITEH